MKYRIDTNRFKIYLGFGLVWLILQSLGYLANHSDKFFQYALNEFWRSIYLIVANFLFFEIILKRISWKQPLWSASLIFAQILIYSVGLYCWRQLGILTHIYTEITQFKNIPDAMSHQMEASMESLLLFGILRHIYDHVKLRETAQQLRIEKQEAELNYLKSQTNPHFLFNTLNNIYSLSRDKSDLAPESILRLSKILRYMLYETNGEFIAVEQELKIMSDYIDLEKLRYDDTLRVNFNYDVEDMKQALPPLLLIPLVENAFKHGVSETRNHPFVDIHLSIKQRQLTFYVKNSTESFPEDAPTKEQIGLTNLRRQLELLYTDYSLSIQPGEGIYTATLKINLSSHV